MEITGYFGLGIGIRLGDVWLGDVWLGLTPKMHGDYLLRLGLGVRLGLWGLIRVAPG